MREEISGADLSARRAKSECRRNTSPIGNPTGGNHRHLYCIDDLRHQGKRARLGRDIVGQKHTAMNTGLVPLCNDRIATMVFEPACFFHRSCRTEHDTTGRLHTVE